MRLVAMVLLALPASAQSLTRGPSLWEQESDSVLIAFQSANRRQPAVEWGETPAFGNVATGPRGTDHAIRLRRMTPDRFHYYRVLLDGQPVGSTHRVRTSPDAGADVSFFVFGDCGTGTTQQLLVRDAVSLYPFDLGLLPGDVVYPAGEPSNFDPHFFQPYASLLPSIPLYPVLGNHDIVTQGGQPFLDAFYLPGGSSGTERWFSFDYGDVHFVGLDGNRAASTTQRDWLANDLAAARAAGARWIFAFFHQPAYTSGPHGRDPNVFANWCPLLEQYEVDAVFCGHDHHYERSTVVRDFFPGRRGVVYFVVGTGGRFLRATGPPQSYSAAVIEEFGALRVTVRGNVLTTSFLEADASGAVVERDVWTRSRGPVTAALRAAGPHPLPGTTYRAELSAPAGSSAWVFAALSVAPVTVGGIGTWHLDPGLDVLIRSATVPARSLLAFSLAVPNDPAFSGSDLFFQAGVIDSGSVDLTDLLVSRVR